MSKFLWIVLVVFSFGSNVFAQPLIAFEGVINYSVTYTAIPENLQPYAQNLPTTFDVYIRDFLVCKEGPTALINGYQTHVKNLNTNSGYIGTQLGGTAVAYRLYPKDYTQMVEAMPTPTSIKYLDETKTIAGFLCKKALVYFNTSTQPLTVYYTDRIPARAQVIYKGLKGFPIYFEVDNNGTKFIAQATQIHPGKQEDSRFLLPSKYRLLSREEYNQAIIQELE